MENQKLTKSEIDIEIKDMLWELVKKWRMILFMAFLCSVVLAAYQYRVDSSKTDVVTVKKSQEELEKSMSVQDLSEVTGAVSLLRQLEQKSQYMDASVLMQIDPYAEHAVLLQYYLVPENLLEKEAIVNAYTSYVDAGSFAQALAETEISEVEACYLDELVSIVEGGTDLYLSTDTMEEPIQLALPKTEDASCIIIKICGWDAESSKALANAGKMILEQYHKMVNSEIGTHTFKLIEETECVLVDQALAQLQNQNATAIKLISNNIDKMKNEMTGDQITLYTYRVTGESQTTSHTVTTEESKPVSISVTHVGIGFVVGIILGCGVVLAGYLLSARLRNSDEIKTLYQIKVLGNVKNPQKKKTMFGFVDQWIEKWKNSTKKTLSYQQEIQMVAANIAIDCKKREQKEVYLTGSMIEQMPEQVLKDIIAKCNEKGVAVTKGNAIAYDAESLETLEQIGQVVFLEQKHSSFYDEMYQEIMLCKENEIYVVGMIVLAEAIL